MYFNLIARIAWRGGEVPRVGRSLLKEERAYKWIMTLGKHTKGGLRRYLDWKIYDYAYINVRVYVYKYPYMLEHSISRTYVRTRCIRVRRRDISSIKLIDEFWHHVRHPFSLIFLRLRFNYQSRYCCISRWLIGTIISSRKNVPFGLSYETMTPTKP